MIVAPSAPHASPLTPHPQHAIGVLGGTFDPIHFGHLRLAEELADATGVAQVRIIPAGQPPHRDRPQTAANHRLEMARLAIVGNSRFALDEREVRNDRPSYTVDTLTDLRRELGDNRVIWLFMGADAFLGLPAWKEWRRLFELANIAVAHRPGYRLAQSDVADIGLRQEIEKRLVPEGGHSEAPPAGQLALHPITPLAISATELRDHLKAGRSVRYLLPDGVLDYIQKHRLYLSA